MCLASASYEVGYRVVITIQTIRRKADSRPDSLGHTGCAADVYERVGSGNRRFAV